MMIILLLRLIQQSAPVDNAPTRIGVISSSFSKSTGDLYIPIYLPELTVQFGKGHGNE